MFLCLYPEWILVVMFTGSFASCSEIVVRGVEGQNITLPCHYNTKSGTTAICWGKGSCPVFRCSNYLIWTDGQQVTGRQSSKYQLMGYIGQGNVSLTIANTSKKDGGIYCCRVKIRGWNNDLKNNIKVVIETGASKPTTDGMPIAITQPTESGFSLEPRWPYITVTPASQTKNISLFFTKVLKEPRKTEKTRTNVYIGIGISALLVVTVTPLILTWHLRKKQKMANSTWIQKMTLVPCGHQGFGQQQLPLPIPTWGKMREANSYTTLDGQPTGSTTRSNCQMAFSNSEIGGIQGPRICAEENIYEMD